MFTLVTLMCISILSAIVLKDFYIRKEEEQIEYRNFDMYSKGNFNHVLCEINDYFCNNNHLVDELKEKGTFINDEVYLFYDEKVNEFCINYRYKGNNYEKALKYVEENGKLIFIPKERKYMS